MPGSSVSDAPTSAWAAELQSGLHDMALALAVDQRQQLLDYLALLLKWNRAYNLTAVRDPALMVRRHLLDSLSILPYVDQGPVLDVGTGAGLPGIPLAIASPGLEFTLLDTNGKKTRFVQQAAGELGLGNVEVVRARVESFDRPGRYTRILSRAFASLAAMVAGTDRLLAADGRWLAMKGAAPHAEVRELPGDLAAEIEPLQVPGEDGARHLVVIRRRVRGSARGRPA